MSHESDGTDVQIPNVDAEAVEVKPRPIRKRKSHPAVEAFAEPEPPQRDVWKVANGFKLLGEQTRLALLLMLAEADMDVGTMCGRLTLSQPAVSHHLAFLRHCDVIRSARKGKYIVYSLTPKGRTMADFAARMGE